MIAKDKAKIEFQDGPIEIRAEAVDGWNVSFERWPPGDYRPLFRGLPQDACHATHYGYCLKGKGKIVFADREEIVTAGQAYVATPGHTFVVLEPFEAVEFTPLTPEYARVGEVVMANMPAWLKARAAPAKR